MRQSVCHSSGKSLYGSCLGLKRLQPCVLSCISTGRFPLMVANSTEDCKDLPPLPVECSRHLTVTLLRHGQSTWNQQNIVQGSTDDSTLTEKGKDQASHAAALLQRLGWHEEFTETWASPLQRARQTAEIVHTSLHLQTDAIKYLHSLREIDLYSLQGMKKRSLQAKKSAAYAAWQQDPAGFELDGHAPVRELWYRASIVWNTLFEKSHENILLVAHSAINQAMIHTVLGLSPAFFRRIVQSNASLSRLEFLPGDGQPGEVLIHAINRVPMTSMIAKEVSQKNCRKIVLACGDENHSKHVVDFIQSVDTTVSWTFTDGRGHDPEDLLESILKQSPHSIVMVDAEACNRITKSLLGISRPQVTFVSDPGSITLLTCPEAQKDVFTLVCSNIHVL